MPDIKVFLSTTSGRPEWRQVVHKAIDDLPGFRSVSVEPSLATGLPAHGWVLQEILASDIFVTIAAGYGTHAADRAAFMEPEQEYEFAKRAGKPIVALLSSEDREDALWLEWPFVRRLRDEQVVHFFDSVKSLRDSLVRSLISIRQSVLKPDFEIKFSPDLSEDQIRGAFAALADYYRACGGVGLSVQFEAVEASVRETVDA